MDRPTIDDTWLEQQKADEPNRVYYFIGALLLSIAAACPATALLWAVLSWEIALAFVAIHTSVVVLILGILWAAKDP